MEATLETTAPANGTPLVRYAVTDADIEATKERYGALVATTRDGYEAVRLAIGECRGLRGSIEKRRVELKADALAWGRKVDSEAKRLTTLLLEIEEPLKAKKQIVDDVKEKARREKEEAERRAVEEQIRVQREAEEARLRVEREKEEARLREENLRLAADRAKLAEDRRVSEEERRAALAAADEARRKLAEEQRALEADRIKAWREEFQRQALIKAQQEAAAQAERERIAAEQFKIVEAERKAAAAKRLEELKPDLEKLGDFARAIRSLVAPVVASKDARIVVLQAVEELVAVALTLEEFGN